jgi:hypothetical protein
VIVGINNSTDEEDVDAASHQPDNTQYFKINLDDKKLAAMGRSTG